MIKVGYNYGNKISCPLCLSKQGDTQEHLFQCVSIKLNSSKIFHMINEKYEDIFSLNIEKLSKISRLCENAWMTREKLLAKEDEMHN